MKKTATLLFFLQSLFLSSQSSQKVIDSIEQIIRSGTNNNEILVEKAGLVTRYFTLGEQEKSLRLYDETLKEALKTRSQPGLAAAYHARGVLFYYQSLFDSSLLYFEKALLIRKNIHDSVGALKSLGNIGNIYFMMEDFKKALGYYEETQKKEEEMHFEEGKYFSINNLGYIYSKLKMYDKALTYFRKAEKVYQSSQNPGNLIYTYDGLSMVYKEQNKLDSALFFALKSLDLATKMGEKHSIGYQLTDIAIIHIRMKKHNLALEKLQQALQIAIPANDQRLQMSIYGNMAAIAVETGKMDNALVYIDKLASMPEDLQKVMNREDLDKLFAEYYFKKGNFKKAFEHLVRFDHYKDSTYSLETTKQINEMQTKFETEKKEKQNQLLQLESRSYKTSRNYLALLLLFALAGIVGSVVAYRKISTSKELLSFQKQLVEEKQKEILDSINYAQRIQFALLASDDLLNTYFPEHFVLFKPKSVVSGDFYWAAPTSAGFVFVTGDCTGHGVPGAFMSLLNISKLSQTINEKHITRPDLILNTVRAEIIHALNPPGAKVVSKDGMDATVCKLDIKNYKLQYASANNTFYILRNKSLLFCKADKMPVGKGHDDAVPFTHSEIALQKGDIIYTFTDGFADQFGGPLGKKFKYKQLEQTLLTHHQLSMDMQKTKLLEVLEKWKGNLEQVDDICIIGVRIS